MIKRYIVLVLGLLIMTFSVRLTSATGWGTSPLSTMPNVFYAVFELWEIPISFGVLMFGWNMLLVIAQILLLRKSFPLIQFLQIPLTLLFSVFLDLSGMLVAALPLTTTGSKIAALAAGILLLAFSVTVTVHAGVVMNSGEGIVKAIADRCHTNFGYTKAALDFLYVLLGIVISFALCGSLQGVGIGTAALALFTGPIIRVMTAPLHKILDRFYIDEWQSS